MIDGRSLYRLPPVNHGGFTWSGSGQPYGSLVHVLHRRQSETISDDVTGLRSMDDHALADVHRDVLDTRVEEHQVAGCEVRLVDVMPSGELGRRVVAELDPAAAQAAIVRPEQS